MIDIIAHFFVLYPLFTWTKDSNTFTKSIILKFAINISILCAAGGFTNMYLMDMTGTTRKQNLYEIMEITPHEYLTIEKRQFKKKYLELSRKYHPDKNEEDTTELFMSLKQAFEILSDTEKRVLYDIYGQVDFSMYDRMQSMMQQKFKDKK